MSEAPHGSLTFAHRFKSGVLCTISIDLEKVRNGTFRPHFHWNGRTHKAREFIGWVRSVFATVCERAQVPVFWVFVHRSGVSETWVFAPGEKPRRIKRSDEPSCNPTGASLLAAAAIGRVATQSDKGDAQ